ncbi:MAG: prolyl oligopeptidase family serine peptidase [Verrucomicrobiaceae bacterium]|nr:prolyl oligopeptidase family serine peptidase [Verrucomicrobiaceae bacterium]
MKSRIMSLVLLSSFVIGTVDAREWTSADGKKLQADFVSLSGDQVVLKLAGGKTVNVPLARFSAEDQVFVKEQSAGEKPAAATGAVKKIEGPYAALITGGWELSEHKGLPFALYGSKDLGAAQKYPLVLALHGKSQNNENGRQVGGWMKSFAKDENYKERPCIVVAPLCYQPYGGTGGGWYDKPGVQAIALVKDLMKSLPIDKDRIYVVGHSMGGFGTCHLINTEPRLFAAGIPMSGCTGPETAGNLKKVPIWMFHAADDATVPPDAARSLAAALKRDKSFKYTEFETGGHGIPPKVFDDKITHEWLFSQTRGK